jgi:hypothetical protein
MIMAKHTGSKAVKTVNKGGKSTIGNEEYASKGVTATDGLKLDAGQGIKQTHSNGSQVGTSGHGKGSSGLERVLAPEKNDDEFGKGTVGAPAELDKLREDGNQDGLGDTTLIYGGGYFEREEAGLEDGVSLRDTMDPNTTEPNYNYDIDPLTGNAPERKVGRANNYEVKGKRGTEFLIGEM